jgi:hypothetical protein
MKVYFHEDQLKEPTIPQELPGREKNRRIVISPLVSVFAMVAIGVGAYFLEKRSHIIDDTNLTLTSSSVENDSIQLQVPLNYNKKTTDLQSKIATYPPIMPELTKQSTTDNTYLTYTKETPPLKTDETVLKEPSTIKNEIGLSSQPVTAKDISAKTVTERAPEHIVTKAEEKVTPALVEPPIQGTNMEKARILFSQEKFYDACALSRLEMNKGNKAQRHEAVLITAQCYLQLGYKPTAQHLLEFVISDGGPGKKEAKRILEDSKK